MFVTTSAVNPSLNAFAGLFYSHAVKQLFEYAESQLKSMYGENDAITIINNCDHYIYLGGMDLLTCQNISLRLNLPLSEILYMPLGTEYIFERGKTPVKKERYHITDELEWQKISIK